MKPLRASLVPLCVLLTACASSPAPVYLSLPTPAYEGPAQSSQRPVLVGPVSVPEAVDRPALLLSTAANRLESAPLVRWAQPLPAELAQALAAQLAQRLANPRVIPSGGTLPAQDYWRLSLEVLRFESRPGEGVQLEALWTLRDSSGRAPSLSRRSSLREAESSADAAALVGAHGRALARLAAEIAAAWPDAEKK